MAKIDATRVSRWTPAWTLLALTVAAMGTGCTGLTGSSAPTVWPGVSTTTPAQNYAPSGAVTTPKTNLAAPSAPVGPATGSGVTPTPAAEPFKATVRGQGWDNYETTAGSDEYTRGPMTATDGTERTVSTTAYQPPVNPPGTPPTYTPPPNTPPPGYIPTTPTVPPVLPPGGSVPAASQPTAAGNDQWITSPYLNSKPQGYMPPAEQLPGTPVPLDILVEEARTGRFMFGAGINSDAGVTGQITVDERNFDIFGFPTSWSQIANGEAFRGRGQAFRLEAMPGNRVQRYLVSFTEPYLFWTPISLNVSAFLYDRGYYDWTESRAGGRVGLGYRLTPDLSVSAGLRLEEVRIKNPRVLGVEELDEVLGNSDFYSSQFSLRHDTRDLPFAPTEGHLIELKYEQAFGEFDYPRGEFDIRKYFMVRERPDGSGRHTITTSLSAGFSGANTPLFENYFAGGFSTIRGFDFRGASPVTNSVIVGGRFRLLGSVEYSMPLTADDMIKAVAFCDYGTVEKEITINTDNFRIAPGFGFRISVPALGPAPLAFDFAFPVASADTDDEQIFSFFFGIGRG